MVNSLRVKKRKSSLYPQGLEYGKYHGNCLINIWQPTEGMKVEFCKVHYQLRRMIIWAPNHLSEKLDFDSISTNDFLQCPKQSTWNWRQRLTYTFHRVAMRITLDKYEEEGQGVHHRVTSPSTNSVFLVEKNRRRYQLQHCMSLRNP